MDIKLLQCVISRITPHGIPTKIDGFEDSEVENVINELIDKKVLTKIKSFKASTKKTKKMDAGERVADSVEMYEVNGSLLKEYYGIDRLGKVIQ